jgi:hypothetical protein
MVREPFEIGQTVYVKEEVWRQGFFTGRVNGTTARVNFNQGPGRPTHVPIGKILLHPTDGTIIGPQPQSWWKRLLYGTFGLIGAALYGVFHEFGGDIWRMLKPFVLYFLPF